MEPSAIINLAGIKVAKLVDIEFWQPYIGYLDYKSLKKLKNLSNKIDFKNTASNELCRDCQNDNQICQSLKIIMFQSIEFFVWVYSNLEKLFLQIMQGYRYYIFLLEEYIKLINVEIFKYKDNALAIFKNYKALCKK